MSGTLDTTYRTASPGRPHAPEAEAEAASELARRASHLHRLVILPCILLGLGLGITGYFLLRALQFDLFGAHIPWLTAIVGIGGPFGAAFPVAERLSTFVKARRRRPWIEDVAARHGVPVETVEEYAALL